VTRINKAQAGVDDEQQESSTAIGTRPEKNRPTSKHTREIATNEKCKTRERERERGSSGSLVLVLS
jgi:hypothetical protein